MRCVVFTNPIYHGDKYAEFDPADVMAIEEETRLFQAQTVKQELAAIRMLFDYLVTGHIVEFNPASSVRGPRFSQKRGTTPVLAREEARQLLESIPIYKDKDWTSPGIVDTRRRDTNRRGSRWQSHASSTQGSSSRRQCAW